jgi:hypothetical protein
MVSACAMHKGGNVPSPLFNFLFLVALFVPIAMYITGVLILMVSIVVDHYRTTHRRPRAVEALAH